MQEKKRLSPQTLKTPLHYDRAKLQPGIVHLGAGAFFRAHVAAYIDRLLSKDDSWGIVGASLRAPATRAALAPQGYLYSQVVRSGAGTQINVIGSLIDVLDAQAQRNQLIAAMVDPRIRIVTTTVTEKGYCHDPASGHVDPSHPDIVSDLCNPERPVTAPGLLVRALELRKQSGTKPFTILCCDNLPMNGVITGRVLSDFAELRSRALADHIRTQIAFPSSMVDRIVPATTDEDRELVQHETGLYDAWPVVTEPFTQWVIEDNFPNGRPDLEQVGVQVVTNVRPFERMKLRMLNGSHSTLAYLGFLCGYEFVAQAIADPAFKRLIYEMMTIEVMPTLPPGLGDIVAYRNALLERFANPALKHRTKQIAMDGSQKLPQRLLETIRDRLAQGQSITRLALGVAAWMRYVTGLDEKGGAIDVVDPLASSMRKAADAAGRDGQRLARALMGFKEIFGGDLAQHEFFVKVVSRHLDSLFQRGAAAVVREVLSGQDSAV